MQCPKCKSEIQLQAVKFCPFCGDSLSSLPEERRKAIVVFADLSGFTALSETLDPDVLRDLIDSLMKKFVSIVLKHGGVVDKIIGDSLLFLFNAERSYGDDPIRTMNTIDAFRIEIGSFNKSHGYELSLHFGVAYGTVSVGTVGTGRTVIGDTVNLASRLLSAAPAGEVFVSPSFAELFGHGYRFEPVGLIHLKGIKKPVSPFRYGGRTAFEEDETPFTGRRKELDLCLSIVREAFRSGRGDCLLLVGDRGAGKTRFFSEIRRSLADEDVTSLTLYFEEGGISFHDPFRTLAERILGQIQFTAGGAGERAASMWAASIRQPGFWDDISFEHLQTFLTEILERAAEEKPLLLFCENVHRAGSSARHLLFNMVNSLKSSPIAFLVSSMKRIEGFARELDLLPLSSIDSRALFEKIAKNVPEGAVQQCGGNPLFLKELARGLNAGLEGKKLFSGNIEFLVASMIDAFPAEDQERIKRASVFGSKIPLHQLADLCDLSRSRMLDHLDRLGLFHFSPGEDVLFFRNDLLRQAAYERINLRVRQAWHFEVAERMVGANALPEEAAYHFRRSGREPEAMRFCMLAGKRLSRLPQQDEALEYLKEAELLARKLESYEVLLEILEFRFDVEARRKGVDEALEILRTWEADAHLAKIPATKGRFALIRGKFLYERRMYKEAQEAAAQAAKNLQKEREAELALLETRILARLGKHKEAARSGMHFLAKKGLPPARRADFWSVLGFVAHLDNEMEQALDFYQKSMTASKEGNDLRAIRVALRNLGNVSFVKGDYDTASDRYREASETALKIGDLAGYCDALTFLGRANFALLRFDRAIDNYRQALAMLGKSHSLNLSNQIQLYLGASLSYLGDTAEAEKLLAGAVAYFKEAEDPLLHGQALRLWAVLLQAELRTKEAVDTVERSISLLEPFPDQLHQALLLRIELLHQLGQNEQARSELDILEKRKANENFSHLVCLELARLASLVTGRKQEAKLVALRTCLQEIGSQVPPTLRLPALVEAMEYGGQTELENEARKTCTIIRNAFPPAFHNAFDQKPYVRRLSATRN